MNVLKIVITVGLVVMVLAIWACCKVSGDCAREEEKRTAQPRGVIKKVCGYCCPACGFDLTILLDAPNAEEPSYCPMCAQQLDWREEDGK